jgi:hypothetical protein
VAEVALEMLERNLKLASRQQCRMEVLDYDAGSIEIVVVVVDDVVVVV